MLDQENKGITLKINSDARNVMARLCLHSLCHHNQLFYLFLLRWLKMYNVNKCEPEATHLWLQK